MGSVNARPENGKLFFDFRYQGKRCREQTTLDDTPANRKKMKQVLGRIEAEITLGQFDYASYFPSSLRATEFEKQQKRQATVGSTSLYLSDFFERNRGSYYDALTRVRESNDLSHWVKFFLSAVIETAGSGKETFRAILALRQEVDGIILGYGKRAKNAQLLLKHLYRRPAIMANDAASLLGVSHQAASALLKKMLDDGLLVEFTGYKRNRVFVFERYLALFNH